MILEIEPLRSRIQKTNKQTNNPLAGEYWTLTNNKTIFFLFFGGGEGSCFFVLGSQSGMYFYFLIVFFLLWFFFFCWFLLGGGGGEEREIDIHHRGFLEKIKKFQTAKEHMKITSNSIKIIQHLNANLSTSIFISTVALLSVLRNSVIW